MNRLPYKIIHNTEDTVTAEIIIHTQVYRLSVGNLLTPGIYSLAVFHQSLGAFSMSFLKDTHFMTYTFYEIYIYI